jgi:hypothetical protein
MGNTKKLPDRLPHVNEFQNTACRFGGNVKPNQRAQAGAVHVGQIRQIEHNSFPARNELADLAVEAIVYSCHQPATTVDDDETAASLNSERQTGWGCGIGHRNLPSWKISNGLESQRLSHIEDRNENNLQTECP